MHTFTSLKLLFVLLAASFCIACAQKPTIPTQVQSPSLFGESKNTPVEVCTPAGQRAYLSRLVCMSGETPTYKRVGNFGARNEFPKNLSQKEEQVLLERVLRGAPLQPGEPDYHIVDGYEVSCGEIKRMIFLDMYHCTQPAPTVAPKGFTLR